jgi:uncharacterized protein (TIGR02466 family)
MSNGDPGDEQPRFADLFPTTIFTCRLPDFDALNRELLAHVAALRAADSGRVRSNQLGWQSRNLDYSVVPVRRFCSLLLERCWLYAENLGWDMRAELQLVVRECWANVNPRYAFNQPHQHPNALISGVYYLQVPHGECGTLALMDPRAQAWVLQPVFAAQSATQVQHVPPEVGRLVLFPSWLEHAVGQNLSDDERISMSFNVDLVGAPDPAPDAAPG